MCNLDGMFEQIDQYVLSCIQLSDTELNYFHSLLKHKRIKKKSFLLRAGEQCNFEAYIIKGCVRVFYIDENGFEVDLFFAVENWWVSDIASFTANILAELNIQALEDCEVLLITKSNKEKLFIKVPAFERIFRLMLQRAYVNITKRLISTISKSAEERYKDFVKKYPDIPQRIPQQLIAAYLGISPEFLSKIRKRMTKAK